MKTTLTFENLSFIYSAMKEIAEIDRSDYFNQYFGEVKTRLWEETVKICMTKENVEFLQNAAKELEKEFKK